MWKGGDVMEEWRDIPGYEKLYQASNLGRIRTAEGKTTSSAKFERRVWKQRIMKQKYHARGNTDKKDARVCLWKDGKEKTHLVSRLVAQTWCDGYMPNLTVNHIDGNPMNNRADNLEWVTIKDNVRKGFETGLFPTQIPVVVVNDGNIELYNSMAKASIALGKCPGYISNKIKKKQRRATHDL